MTRETIVNIIRTVAEMRAFRTQAILNRKTIGLVPTMGALHQGHLNLVHRSVSENDFTVVSIFVNPSQFAPHEDLSSYPRTLDTDLQALSSVSPAANNTNSANSSAATNTNPITVFLPSVTEMYPSGISLEVSKQVGAFVEVKGLSEQLEGSIRPHFFRGVATIVTKLINAVQPDRSYFGQKDIQQVTVVKRMVKDLLIPTEIVMVPTAREDSSLAMSSRNAYLSASSRHNSSILYRALASGEQLYKNGSTSRSDILAAIHAVLEPHGPNGDSDFKVEIEYISIADKSSLKEVEQVVPGEGAVISAAIRVPNKEGAQTRIIDNILLD